MIKICSYVKRYRRQGRRRVSHVSEYTVMSTDRSEVIYRPGKHGVEHVVISDGQTLTQGLGPTGLCWIMLDNPKPPCREAALKGV